MGVTFGSNLWDLTEFYEYVDVGKLAAKAMEMKYPARVMYLSAVVYLAPRIIREDGGLSPPIYPQRSVAAGCRNAPNFAEVVLYDLLEECKTRHALVSHHEWVDDLTHRTEGTRRQVEQLLIKAGIHLASVRAGNVIGGGRWSNNTMCCNHL